MALAGAAAVALLAYDNGGAQWGPHYLLFAFPLLIVLALSGRQAVLEGLSGAVMRRVVAYGFVGVVSISIFLQGLSLLGLEVKQQLATTAMARVEALHPKVVVSAWPVIDVLAPDYYRGLYLYSPEPGAMNGLVRHLRTEGYRRVVMVSGPVDACQSNGYRNWTHARVRRVPHIIRYAVYTAAG